MCRGDVRCHPQPFPAVLAGHVAGDLAENVPAQVQEPGAPAQSQGRVQGRTVRARRRVLDAGRGRPPPRPAAAAAVVGGGGGIEKEPRRQETPAAEQIKVHGPVGHIRSDGGRFLYRRARRRLSLRIQVHGKAGRSKTGSYYIFNAKLYLRVRRTICRSLILYRYSVVGISTFGLCVRLIETHELVIRPGFTAAAYI